MSKHDLCHAGRRNDPVLPTTVRTYAAAVIAKCLQRRETVRLPTGI
jgi:hypothetical protein